MRPEVAQEMAVAGQENAVFPIGEVDERSVVERRVVHRVIAQHAKPAGETPEHRVSEKAKWHGGLPSKEQRDARLVETKPAVRACAA
jgi:hypothetical protein